jgi:hypothetical protein
MAGLQLAGVSALRASRHENECNRALERFNRAHCAQIQALEAQGYEVKIARDWGTPADAWYLVLTPKKSEPKPRRFTFSERLFFWCKRAFACRSGDCA